MYAANECQRLLMCFCILYNMFRCDKKFETENNYEHRKLLRRSITKVIFDAARAASKYGFSISESHRYNQASKCIQPKIIIQQFFKILILFILILIN